MKAIKDALLELNKDSQSRQDLEDPQDAEESVPISVMNQTLMSFPISGQLGHIRKMDSPDLSVNEDTDKQPYHQLPVLISDGLPPVPVCLVKQIKQGIFVEMAELLPNHLGSAGSNAGDRCTNKTKLNEVDNILD